MVTSWWIFFPLPQQSVKVKVMFMVLSRHKVQHCVHVHFYLIFECHNSQIPFTLHAPPPFYQLYWQTAASLPLHKSRTCVHILSPFFTHTSVKRGLVPLGLLIAHFLVSCHSHHTRFIKLWGSLKVGTCSFMCSTNGCTVSVSLHTHTHTL